MRGEFILGTGETVQNNFTSFGAKLILERALQGASASQLYLGICTGVFDSSRLIQELNEPSFTNGYGRQLLSQSLADWPIMGQVNGEWYVESKDVVFAAVGGNFSLPFNRPFLTTSQSGLTGEVIALGKPTANETLVTPATPPASRTMRYRLYAR